MKCSTCDSERIVDISAKCGDKCSMTIHSEDIDDYHGYVPCEMGIGGDDYMDFEFCLDCGQIQGNWPGYIPDEAYN